MRVRTRALGGGLIFVFWLLNLTRSHPFPVQTATDLNYAASGVEHSGNARKEGRTRQCALDNTRVRNLCGMVVENRDGQTLGKLEDFIVDMPSGQVTYAQISAGGLFGLRKHLGLVPPQLLSAATAKRGVVELNIGYNRWRHAPRFQMSDLVAVGSPQQKARIYQYYGLSVTEANPKPVAHARASRGSGTQPSPTGRDTATNGERQSAKASLAFAAVIIGKTVVDRHGEILGQVSDLLVDLTTHRTTLALLSPDSLFGGKANFAVPLCLLSPSGEEKLVVDANRELFAAPPVLDEQSWKKESNSGEKGIYRFPASASGVINRSATEATRVTLPLDAVAHDGSGGSPYSTGSLLRR